MYLGYDIELMYVVKRDGENSMRHYRLFQAWQNQDKEYTDFITS